MEPLEQIRYLVAIGDYILRGHALDAVLDGEFGEEDIEACILRGHIKKRECDELKEAVDGKKYTIMGPDYGGLSFGVVGKIVAIEEGRRYVVITAYKDCIS